VTTQPINQELGVHDWDAPTGTLGPARVLVSAHGGDWVKLPGFLVGRPLDRVRAREGGEPADDGCLGDPQRWRGRADRADRRSSSRAVRRVPSHDLDRDEVYRAVGARSRDLRAQLWAMASYPDRRLGARAFRLPGQRPDVGVRHAPVPRRRQPEPPDGLRHDHRALDHTPDEPELATVPVEVTMKPANKMPKAIRISRKLKLSSEKLVVMAEDHPAVVPTRCTKKLTGCGPVHTC
jgi:hypothetical protein